MSTRPCVIFFFRDDGICVYGCGTSGSYRPGTLRQLAMRAIFCEKIFKTQDCNFYGDGGSIVHYLVLFLK